MAKKNTEVLFEEPFDTDLKGRIAYVLCVKNEARGRIYDADGNPIPDPEYQKRRNLLLKSSIVWPGGKDPFSGKERSRGRHPIRYYDGCTSLFVDDQPRESAVLEPLIAGTRSFDFHNGYLHVDAFESMLNTYIEWASWNEFSPYRNPRIQPIYKLYDTEQMLREEAFKMDQVEEAILLAKKASVKQMRIHARFLKILDIDEQTLRPLSDEAIRTEYRKSAMHNPKRFIDTFNDKSIHIKHWIELALASGELSTSEIPNRVIWTKAGIEVCDTSGLTTNEGKLNKLIELAQTDQGAEFKDRLEALYGK